ncbi:hypothetical protein OROGR_012791 [Orobanche gracilis]
MSSEAKSTKREDEDLSRGLLLRDIEEISKALYLHKTPHKPFNSSHEQPDSESNSVTIQNLSDKDMKSSLWKWKPLKALVHLRNHRFSCCFFLRVHAIEGLPPNFDNLNLCVAWKRKADVSRTQPILVRSGMAEFEETLMHRSTVYGRRSGPHGSAKYEPKIFSLSVFVAGQTELHIGNHYIDLSRLLPVMLEELEGDNGSSGKEIASFKLTGEALGAVLNVSFGFSVLNGNSFESGCFVKVPDIVRKGEMNPLANFDVPKILAEGSCLNSQSIENVNFLKGIFPKQESELSHSVILLYKKLDEKKIGNVMDFGHLPESEFNDNIFDVIEQGIEVSTNNQIKIEKCGSQRFDSTSVETIDVAEIFKDEAAFDEFVQSNAKLTDNHEGREYDNNEPAFEEYSTVFPPTMPTSKPAEDYVLDIKNYYYQESYIEPRSTKSHFSSDDVSESIENEFLNMLSIDQNQDKNEDDINMLSIDQNQDNNEDDYDLSFPIHAVEKNHETVNQSSLRNRRNAKMLENLETVALMHEWGITEKAFQYSPHTYSGGFGSPVYIPAEEPLNLPSIEEGVGPMVQTKDGGILRSMSPLLFANANNGARLIAQASAPVVLPRAIGLTVMEVLQSWACGGLEKMCVQVNELMPLEDVTGKTMREVLSEGESGANAFNRRWVLQRESGVGIESPVERKTTGHSAFAQTSDNIHCSNYEQQIESSYVTFEELVPMAITNIEGLLVQGLKIESGMADQEAPSSIEIKATELLCNFSSGSAFVDVDGLMKSFLSLDEWTRLGSSEFYVETIESEQSRVLDRNFKMGFKVQLRDPSRNYETVGLPMLALIQVDMIYSSEKKCDWFPEGNGFEQKETKTGRPLFKVTEVHLAGLNLTDDNKQLWGTTSRQRQSGSRWLFSSGMVKSSKNIISSSSAVVKYPNGLLRKARTEDVLWSISLPNRGEATTWDEQVAFNVHVRNPDIVFPK